MDRLTALVEATLKEAAVETIEIVDVGASNLRRNRGPSYDGLIEAGYGRVTGFEPNEAEFTKLPQSDVRRYLCEAVGDGRTSNFNITSYPGFSSTLTPNLKFAAQIANFEEEVAVTHTSKMPTRKLDEMKDISRMDYLKIDIQGGECRVFNGAKRLLSEALCVHTETSFGPLYENQPLFGDQQAYMKRAGLVFLGFDSTNKHPVRSQTGGLSRKASRRDLGVWIDADAVFIRDFATWSDLETDAIVRLFLLTTGVYFAPSAALKAAALLQDRGVAKDGIIDTTTAFFNEQT